MSHSEKKKYEHVYVYKPKMPQTNLDDMPVETFVDILGYIDGCSLARCRQVCRFWKETIDGRDSLWKEKCRQEYKFASAIAKRKSGIDCSWFYIYRNLTQWSTFTRLDITVKELYRFAVHDKAHLLDVDYGVLQLRDSIGTLLFDTTTFNCIPIAMDQPNCHRIASTDRVSIAQIKSGVLIQRSVDSPDYMTEEYFRADDFVLTRSFLYFFFDHDVYRCDLRLKILEQELIFKSKFFFKTIVHSENMLHLFTEDGKIVNIDSENKVIVKPVDVPWEWVKHMRHVRAVNDTNYVYYSRNIFKITTDTHKHLYLEFPPITALFFYVNVVIIGTKAGKILIYRLATQKRGVRPSFETIATLPNMAYAVKLDICEGKSGPTIIVSTFNELYLLEMNFFTPPEEERQKFPVEKQLLYKRLLRIKKRIQL